MRAWAWIGLVALAALTARGEEFVWRYTMECLGDAEKAQLIKPGAEGSAAAMALHYQQGAWSRFNWPMFRPVKGNTALRVQLRREGALPKAAYMRLLTRDGVEWQLKKAIALTEDWQAAELTPDDFKFYRGADPEKVLPLSFDHVIQYHVLPVSNHDGAGILVIDSFGFVPNGPVYTHDADEWQRPPEPTAMEYARLQDLRERYQLELAQLAGSREHVLAWTQELQAIRELWAQDSDAARARPAAPTAPWKQRPAAASVASALPAMTEAEFHAHLAALDGRPPTLVNDFRTHAGVSNYVLYQAVPQTSPKRIEENGELFVRQQVIFTGQHSRQTVFLSMVVPAGQDRSGYLDVSGRVIVMKVRCSARVLHEQRPFCLRLRSEHPEGLEAFLDLQPQSMPGKDWTECRFDVGTSFRSARFDPRKVTRMELRVENVPGEADSFALDAGPIYLAYPPALSTARDEFLADCQQQLLDARMALLTARNELLQVEDALRVIPDLRSLYLSSFNQKLRQAAVDVASLPKPLPLYSGPPVASSTFRTRLELADGQAELVVCLSAAAARLCVELRDAVDVALLAAVDYRDGVDAWQELRLPVNVPLWSPGNAHLYQLRMVAYSADGTVLAAGRRQVGLRESALFASGITPLLRQELTRRRPEWFFRYNGQAAFPRTAAFSWMEESLKACPAETASMLADLWVEGGRFYGLKLSEAFWSLFERGGYAQLAAFYPSYKALKSWDDMQLFGEQLSFIAERMAQPSSHASPFVLQVGNEVELDSWGASINTAFPGTPFQPLDYMAEVLRRERLDSSPIMYVRAGHFNTVVPLPHEDVCGINQYTGRYSGRLDEVHRDLAELAAEAALFNRPLMITEWNGPKYSWATGGIGGVTIRGAAYYLERYWRGLAETPGVVGSAEFTLNWVIAPFEDLTNQSREEAWKNRPRHAAFGGGRTADHVPLLHANQVVPDECYRSMQAFHGPFYVMAKTPGDIQLLAALGAVELASALAPLRGLGKELAVDSRSAALVAPTELPCNRHCVVVMPVGSGSAALPPAWSGLLTPLAAGASEPLIRTMVHPHAPDYLLCVVQAADVAGLWRAIRRLGKSAAALFDLRAKESQMRRAVALVDLNREQVFRLYVLEQAGRGFFFTGDDTRTTLLAEDFYDEAGQLLPCWSALSTMYLDAPRALTADEWSLVQRLHAGGVTLVISSGCYQANAALQAAYPATLAVTDDFSQYFSRPLSLHASLQGPAPLRALGGVDFAVVERFAPEMLKAPGVGIQAIRADGATALAWDEQEQAVIVRWPSAAAGQGAVVLLGYQLGDVAQVHWRVTHNGQTHRIYDRDTACGLERASLAAVNAGLPVARPGELLPALQLYAMPESFLVAPGEAARLLISVRDSAGRPVPGAQVNARARVRQDGRNGANSDYVRLRTDAEGNFAVSCVPENASGGENVDTANLLMYKRRDSSAAKVSCILSVQLKAWAQGYLPADSACAFVLSE
ncbi:MAG TPA: hypothetical protein PLT23_01170 [Lentisphaeria bacterium]|nr:hypothetical protein [Lentisphaerota bacterium]OQC12750.1 MAG: hypothetical protein BWX73_02726 [Lentisphaerae bacterium ADurb.Bin082]HPY89305.1 hypothetical protein [Lentisphaeria bacterium]HQL87628.1 hypothetical protein [Lentisphaeria bacterium]